MFPKYNPIPWTRVRCNKGNRQLFKYNPRFLDDIVKFDEAPNDWEPCRRYSYNATIMTSDGTFGSLLEWHSVDLLEICS